MSRLLFIVPLFLIGCDEDPPPCSPGDCAVTDFCDTDQTCKALPPFNDDFLWGTAIAGFQADYGCPTLPREECEDVNSDWFTFTTDPRTVESDAAFLSGDHPSEVGPGFWELYEADFERASSELENNAFRLSIEWSRIFPTATDAAAAAMPPPRAQYKNTQTSSLEMLTSNLTQMGRGWLERDSSPRKVRANILVNLQLLCRMNSICIAAG